MEIGLAIFAGLLIGVLLTRQPERSSAREVVYVPLPQAEEQATGCLSTALLIVGTVAIVAVGYILLIGGA